MGSAASLHNSQDIWVWQYGIAIFFLTGRQYSNVRTVPLWQKLIVLFVPNTWLTLGADNSSIRRIITVAKYPHTINLMTAVQKRGFISSTAHTIQEYWGSVFPNVIPEDSNSYITNRNILYYKVIILVHFPADLWMVDDYVLIHLRTASNTNSLNIGGRQLKHQKNVNSS